MHISILYDILIRNNAYNDTARARINTRVPPRIDNRSCTRDMSQNAWVVWHTYVSMAIIVLVIVSGALFGLVAARRWTKNSPVSLRDRFVKRGDYARYKQELDQMSMPNVKRHLVDTNKEYKANLVNIEITQNVIGRFRREIRRTKFAEFKRKTSYISSRNGDPAEYKRARDLYLAEKAELVRQLDRHTNSLRVQLGNNRVLGAESANMRRYIIEQD